MKSLIDKNKQISKQRQELVEHNFEAMVGARKRRYNDTPQQKQRTEFFEDYYLLYTRTKDRWQKLKEWLEEKNSWNERQLKEAPINTEFYIRVSVQGITINKVLDKMQELEGEDE